MTNNLSRFGALNLEVGTRSTASPFVGRDQGPSGIGPYQGDGEHSG